jgi:ketosteroid isomerase-like protein
MTAFAHRVLSSLVGLGLLGLAACSDADETLAAGDTTDTTADVSAQAPSGSTPALSRDEQVAIIEQRLDATNRRDWDTWESLHTPDAIRTAPELEQPLQGAAAMRAAIETLSVAFPDYHLELERAFGQGEWLALRIHTTGTMTGPLTFSDGTQLPATGQPIQQDWAALVRFDGDHIAEFHEFYDQLTLMVQLGVVTP